jgi:hypothetical protein
MHKLTYSGKRIIHVAGLATVTAGCRIFVETPTEPGAPRRMTIRAGTLFWLVAGRQHETGRDYWIPVTLFTANTPPVEVKLSLTSATKLQSCGRLTTPMEILAMHDRLPRQVLKLANSLIGPRQ